MKTKTDTTADFSAQYKHPNWQKKRLEILERDNFSCCRCGDKESILHVHHVAYEKGHKIWEYESIDLYTLCDCCHKAIHDQTKELEKYLRIIKRKSCFPVHKRGKCLSIQFINFFLGEIICLLSCPDTENAIVSMLTQMANTMSVIYEDGYSIGSVETEEVA